jgi:hypothetical protein
VHKDAMMWISFTWKGCSDFILIHIPTWYASAHFHMLSAFVSLLSSQEWSVQSKLSVITVSKLSSSGTVLHNFIAWVLFVCTSLISAQPDGCIVQSSHIQLLFSAQSHMFPLTTSSESVEVSSYDALAIPGGSQLLLSARMVSCTLIAEQVQRKCGGLICSQPWLPPAQDQFVQMKPFNAIGVVLLTQRPHPSSDWQQLDNCLICHPYVHFSLVDAVDGPIDACYIICFSIDAMVVGEIPSDQPLKHPWPPPGLLYLTNAGVDLWALQWLLQLQFYHLLVEDP